MLFLPSLRPSHSTLALTAHKFQPKILALTWDITAPHSDLLVLSRVSLTVKRGSAGGDLSNKLMRALQSRNTFRL